MINTEHETKFIEAFVRKEKRNRFRLGLNGLPKHRNKILRRFDHALIADLTPTFVTQLQPGLQSVHNIKKVLLEKKAPLECYLISSSIELDQKVMMLEEALNIVGYYGGTIISAIPGRLAYYESDDMRGRYILEKA